MSDANHRAQRDILHANKNEAQKAVSTARVLLKASDEALRVAQAAIVALEASHKRHEKSNEGN